MRKPSKTTLRNKCDDLWKKIIHLKQYCEVCGSPNHTNSHHIITRGNLNLRWDLQNGCLLCVNHHRFGNPCAHGNPIWFTEWLMAHRSDDYEYLKNPDFTKTKTWRISDYEQIYQELKEEYERSII
jgi:hypothetical protein